MRMPGRMSAAIEVLQDVLQRHRPAALALQDWARSHRFAGSADRAAIGNLVYDVLRRDTLVLSKDAVQALEARFQ